MSQRQPNQPPPPELVSTLTSQVHSHFMDKYPSIYPATGIGKDGIQKLVTKSLSVHPTNDKVSGHKFGSRDDIRSRMNNLVALLESRLKTEMYRGTRIGVQPNPAQHITDPLSEIPYSSYTERSPEDLILKKPDVYPTPVTKYNNDSQSDRYSQPDRHSQPLGDEFIGADIAARPDGGKVPDNSYDPLSQAIADEGAGASSDQDLERNGQVISTIDRAHESIRTTGAAQDVTYVQDREFQYYIAIDSKDRNYARNTSPGEFVIDFSPGAGSNASNGYINTSFGNIISCELMNAIILDTTDEPDSTDSTSSGTLVPYVILELPELERRFEGTSDTFNKAFAILSDYSVKNGFKHYNVNTNGLVSQARVVFNPRRSINRLTIRILQPNGELFNFGSANDSNNETVVHLLLKITTLQKNLGTNYIGTSFH